MKCEELQSETLTGEQGQMSSVTSGQINSYYCSVCNISCTGAFQYKQHFIGSKHLKKLKTISATSQPVLNSCKPSVTYQSGTELYAVNKALNEKVLIYNSKKELYCTTCRICFTGDTCAESHLIGRKHKKALLLQDSTLLLHINSDINAMSNADNNKEMEVEADLSSESDLFEPSRENELSLSQVSVNCIETEQNSILQNGSIYDANDKNQLLQMNKDKLTALMNNFKIFTCDEEFFFE